jgi:hypothetical protein
MSAATLSASINGTHHGAIGHRFHDGGQGREQFHHRLLPEVVRPADLGPSGSVEIIVLVNLDDCEGRTLTIRVGPPLLARRSHDSARQMCRYGAPGGTRLPTFCTRFGARPGYADRQI